MHMAYVEHNGTIVYKNYCSKSKRKMAYTVSQKFKHDGIFQNKAKLLTRI